MCDMTIHRYNCPAAHIQSFDIDHCDVCAAGNNCEHCADDPEVDYENGGCAANSNLIDDKCPDCEEAWGANENQAGGS